MGRRAAVDYEQLTRRRQIRRMRQAAECALSLYGIEPAFVSLLNHSHNTTFVLSEPDGARTVLHINRPPEEAISEAQWKARVESELWWLDRVRADLRLPVPVPVRTPDGEGAVAVSVEGMTSTWLCTLFRWVDGRFLRHRFTPAQLEAVGRLTARLHEHSASLHVPAWFDRPGVDAADVATEESIAGLAMDYVSPPAADVVRRVFGRVRRAQQELGGKSDTFGLIHADIHQKNYLFQRGEARLIDFGDCGWGHYLYDPAVTLSELADESNLPELRAALLAGYRQVRDLPAAQEALIDAFVMLREVQNLTWFFIARDDPSFSSLAAGIGERVAGLERLLPEGA